MWRSAVLVLCWIARSTAIDDPELSCETRDSSAKSSSLLQVALAKPAVPTSSAIHEHNAVEIPGKATKGSLQSEHNLTEQSQTELRDVQHSSMMSSRGNIGEARHLNDSDIDFVYCWSGEAAQTASESAKHAGLFGDARDPGGHNAGFGYNEMMLSLRSLQKFAPWFNKVYLLVDGPAKPPFWAEDDTRIVMVDRCKLFPRSSDCPTHNTAACQSVLHLVPGLLEKFVYMDDDFFLLGPVTPWDFFTENGTPLLTIDVKEEWLQPVYAVNHDGAPILAGPDMPPAKVPTSIYPRMFIHAPTPMLLSFSAHLEEEFADWFAFVRSHKERFVCCDATHRGFNATADLFHVIYPAMLYKNGIGKPNAKMLFRNGILLGSKSCNCENPECIEGLLGEPERKCLVLSNCRDPSLFRAAQTLVIQHMT